MDSQYDVTTVITAVPVNRTAIQTALCGVLAKIITLPETSPILQNRDICATIDHKQVKKYAKCIAVDGTTATLSWSDVSDDDISYFVVECKQSDGVWKSVSRTSTNLGVNLSGLTPEHDYVYRVIGS